MDLQISTFNSIFGPMQPLKILHLSSERTWRGGEQQIAYLIEESIKSGLEIWVAVRKDSEFENWCRQNGIRHFGLGLSNGLSVFSALKLKNFAAAHRIDIVHVHSGKSHSVAYLAALLGMKRPIVVHRRVDFPIGKSAFSRRKFNHKSVAKIICVSGAIATMVRQVVADTTKVKTIHSGIDFSRFEPAPATGYLHEEFGLERNKNLVANVSAIAPHKDYFTFLQVAKKLLELRNDVHFLVVGSGNLLGEVKGYADLIGIAPHVTFTGFRQDIPNLLRELSVFLMTSATEGLGTTIIDAMYNGVPVVATRAGGIPELVRDGETGALCPVKDVDALANAVALILDNPDLASAYSKQAMEAALEFSKEVMAQKVIGAYKSCI